MGDETSTRLSANINAETRRELEDLATRQGVSVTEVVRRAVSVYKFVKDETESGTKELQVIDKETGNRSRLIVF